MSQIELLEQQIAELDEDSLRKLREWFIKFEGLCRFVWNLPPAALDRHRCMATPSRIAAGVDGAVKGGRSPAKRTLYCARNANTLRGSGLVAASRGQLPSPSGGEDFPALGAGLGVGHPKGSAWGARAPFHTKRTKPKFDQARWDKKLEADSSAGRLDFLVNAALDEHKSGQTRDL